MHGFVCVCVCEAQLSREPRCLDSMLSACDHLPSSRCLFCIINIFTHTQYAISDSPEIFRTLVSLSALNCLLCLVWKGSPRVSAQWPQKCEQPKSSDIIHLLTFVCLSLLPFLSHPTLCLHSVAPTAYFLSSFLPPVSPELHCEQKRKGTESQFFWHCWVGLVLSYGGEGEGLGD